MQPKISHKKSKLLRSLVFGSLIAVPVAAQSTLDQAKATEVQQAQKKYDELVRRVKSGDKTVDFIELISAASDLSLVSPGLVTAPRRDEMVGAFKKKDYKSATQLAETVLDYEFTNRGLHLATENAYRELTDNARADFHRGVGDSILKAVLSTGDGKTTETAYCVQGINEEYVIMRHFGYEVTSQAYLTSDGVEYDLLSGTDKKTKKPVELYFDISGYFSRCVQRHRKAVGPK